MSFKRHITIRAQYEGVVKGYRDFDIRANSPEEATAAWERGCRATGYNDHVHTEDITLGKYRVLSVKEGYHDE